MVAQIDDAMERAYPAIASGNVQQLLLILRDCPALAQSPSADLVRYAIERDQFDVLDALLQAGIPADRIDEMGTTALMDAAATGHLEMGAGCFRPGLTPTSFRNITIGKSTRMTMGRACFLLYAGMTGPWLTCCLL